MRQRTHHRGQSMLEALLAIGIIVTSVSSSITVVSAAINAEKDSESTIVGSNLAREGIEAVRSVRDSNWLASAIWDTGISGDAGDYVGVPVLDPALGTWSMEYAPDDFTDDATRVYRYATGSGAAVVGLMVQAAAQPSEAVVTPFRRLVETHPICTDGSIVDQGETCGAQDKIGIQVLSKVRWNISGRPKEFTAEERLYDWR
jgi:hypothetical protein